VRGAALNWPGVFSGGERRVALPLYAWQRERYWSAARNAVTEMTAGTTYPEECVADTATHTGWDAGSESEQRQALLRLIGAEAARILSLRSAEEIDSRQPLSERGMDSLMALELRRALAKKTGLKLPATLAFDFPTPSDLADALFSHYRAACEQGEYSKTERTSCQQVGTADVDRFDDMRISALTEGQQRLWFLDKINPMLPVNNIHHGVKFSGHLDVERLRACLALLVARHESLRTTFIDIPVYASGEDEPRALIAPRGAVPLEITDLSTAQDRQDQIARLAYAQRVRPFDITHGPLWRSLLITEQPRSHLLLLTHHHLISDGWSVVRLVKELVALYLSPELPAAPQPAQPDYSDYVSYQRHSLAGEAHQQSLAWWREKLKDLPRLALPIARNTLAPSHRGDAVRIDISHALTEQVRRFSQQNSCTVFVTLLSAWATTLYRYSGQTDFGIGTLSAGRENSDFDEVQGFFVNILVLRPALAATMSFAQLANAMGLEVLESLRRQDTEFSEVAAGFTGSRSLDLNPLVQASFDFNSWPAAYQQDDFGCEWLDLVRGDAGVEGTTRFNLGLALLEKSDGIVGTLEFAVDLFERSSVENLVEQFLVLLDGATAQPATDLARLPMHTPDP
ncbi:condensation domain-containing protein, partial [Serratia ficaria]|uniref:condensation domain-containing protein n=1 Tax=Serratia ficaria TaxID=61651 RepID=UPI0021C8E66B